MNFQFYLEKLQNSESFKNFMKENSEAYLCSCFFIIDKQGADNKQHFDYFLPQKKKTFSFQLEDNCKLIPIDTVDTRIPEKILESIDFDFNEIEKILDDKMQEQGIREIQKILLSLQKLDSVNYLIGTVFIPKLSMIKFKINLDKKELIQFEKKSFFDMVNIFKKK